MFSSTLKRLSKAQIPHLEPAQLASKSFPIYPSRPFSSTLQRERDRKKVKKSKYIKYTRLPKVYHEHQENVHNAIALGEIPEYRVSPKGKHHEFHDFILVRFAQIAPPDVPWPYIKAHFGPYGVRDMEHYLLERKQFRNLIDVSIKKAAAEVRDKRQNALYFDLRSAFAEGGTKQFDPALRYAFQMFLFRDHFTPQVTYDQKRAADLRFPWEWYPATRAMQRTVHLHIGPTNSGKTYHALKALEEAKNGVYCGPLRLLAHEIYSRFKAKGKPCALITGEEQKIPQDADEYFISCTVEMTPLQKQFDVAVIDEIQMISDLDRGNGWTAAFLGLQAKELHLCGEERTVKIIQSLCQSIGDKCVVHQYKRLTPLQAAEHPIQNDWSELEKGDCIVAFSRLNLHLMKKGIEEKTGKSCAIIYGSLPPEVRAQQATLFNDPENDYDYLVASDAIGMGLNLEIKRVVFQAVDKNDGRRWRELDISEIRQIGGRAGRFKTARQSMTNNTTEESKVGYVTAMDKNDLKVIQKKLWKDAPPIKSVGVFPPVSKIERFATFFPKGTSLSVILLRMQEMAQVSSRFFLHIKQEILDVANIIQQYDLTIADQCVLLTAPAYLRDPNMAAVIKAIAHAIASGKGGGLLEVPEIQLTFLDIVDIEPGTEASHLKKLESLHSAIVLYLWVSYRFPHIFKDQQMAFEARSMAQTRINEMLSSIEFSDDKLIMLRKMQRAMVRNARDSKQKILGEEAVKEGTGFDDSEPVEVETKVLVEGLDTITKE